MAKKKKPSRTPVRRASKKAKSPKIKKDPIKEYQAALRVKDKNKPNVMEVLDLADDDCLAHVKLHVSTQSLALDRLLNGRGFPAGRVSEIYGPPYIGKSTLLDHAFASVQQMGGVAILADTEGARSLDYTTRIGVDPKKLQYIEFAKGHLHVENVLIAIYRSIEFWRDKAPDTPVLIGWDALGGTATRDEIAKELAADENAKMAGAAKVLREACRLIPTKLGNSNIAVVIINHEYEKIGAGGGRKETYGGAAVRHLASIRVQLHPVRSGWIKRSSGEIIGRQIGANLIKNRLGNPWGEARIALLSGVGINNTWTIFETLKAAGVIETSGSWSGINLDGEVLKFQGFTGLEAKCAEDETLFPRLVSVYQGLP